VLHIHANVDLNCEDPASEEDSRPVEGEDGLSWRHESWRRWARATVAKLRVCASEKTLTARLLAVNKVKSYAPKVDHLVLDVKCEFQ